jgi:tRNA G10  N-methylase Trm11
LYRREGFSLFMKRLTRSASKRLHAGELSPQLAWLLCLAGKPGPGETTIDPFCGYGSIPEAALKHFPIKKLYASDTDDRCVKIVRSKPGLKTDRCEIRRADVFSVSDFLPKEGVDVIITDPPWGMYRETKIPLEKFYEDTLALFSRLLKGGGRAVVLTAARREIETAAEKTPDLSMTKIIPILVSGKKAAVYVMGKAVH